jgi:hypothetical protein
MSSQSVAPSVAAALLVVGSLAIGTTTVQHASRAHSPGLTGKGHTPCLHGDVHTCAVLRSGWLMMWRIVLSKIPVVRALCGLPPSGKKTL